MTEQGNKLGHLPIIGLCGSSGSGKTTLLEGLIGYFQRTGLRVAVVKHGAHRVRVDTPGKDSDRFFCAGADVALFGEEHFFRTHDSSGFHAFLRTLCVDYDLVLVEGHASTDVPKIWLLGKGYDGPPDNAGNILHVLAPEDRQVEPVAAWIEERVNLLHQCIPLYGCLLIGGKSSRMGRPKHLIEQDGRTWVEAATASLESRVEQVVLAGGGEIPSSLARLPRLPDVPGLAGPLAGVLSALRWQPEASWIVAACDQPDISGAALDWLKERRRPGVRAILPDLSGDGRLEPLLAWYDFRAVRFMEQLAGEGNLRLGAMAGKTGVITPQPPPALRAAWRNVNTPEELQRYTGQTARVD